jgi:hypothetical protein
MRHRFKAKSVSALALINYGGRHIGIDIERERTACPFDSRRAIPSGIAMVDVAPRNRAVFAEIIMPGWGGGLVW